MDLGIAGRTAIVTGASQGICKQIALSLAKEGAEVVVCARTQSKLEEAARDIAKQANVKVLAISADVTNPADVEHLVAQTMAEFGRIDILVNGANHSRSADFFQLSDEDWLDHFDVKLVGKIRVIRAVVPHMKEQRWGRIINIAGGSARRSRQQSGRIYGWSSGVINPGIANLSKRLCDELGPYGITVNTLLPGGVETPGKELRRANAAEAGVPVQDVATERPISRPITAADSAHLVCFVASDLAGALTGQVLSIDGGATPAVYY